MLELYETFLVLNIKIMYFVTIFKSAQGELQYITLRCLEGQMYVCSTECHSGFMYSMLEYLNLNLLFCLNIYFHPVHFSFLNQPI